MMQAQSKREQHRASLKRQLETGKITQALYEAKMARQAIKTRGKRSELLRAHIRALDLYAKGRITKAERDSRIAQVTREMGEHALVPFSPAELAQKKAPGEATNPPPERTATPDTAGSPGPKATAKDAAKTWQRNTSAAHDAKRQEAAAKWAALVLPPPHRDARQWMAVTVREAIGALPHGGHKRIAQMIGVDSSRLTKYLLNTNIPTQAQVDTLAAWMAQGGRLVSEGGRGPAPAVEQARTLVRAPVGTSAQQSISRLSPEISARLKAAARRANVTPVQLAEQILGGHLAPLESTR